ncbi:MAG: hypothetical protein C0617_08010 [Desulfuromonas sp.]|nr:MAG: hypothetical protein C0617_08010 [Desulfuromonas sp.]
MHIEISFDSWLEHLRCLLPVTGMLHVGAGAGAGSAKNQYDDWGVPNVLFVGADGGQDETLDAMVQGREGWVEHKAFLSDSEGEADFYIGSEPNGCSLLPSESFARVAGVKLGEKRRLKTTTIESLLSSLNYSPHLLNWATIDCIPALPIVQGAGEHLGEWDVIVARVLFDGENLPEHGATKGEVDGFLSSSGYLCVATKEDELRSSVGQALYVRHWQDSSRTRVAELQKRSTEKAAEHAKAVAGLEGSLRSQEAVVVQCREEVAFLTKARDEQAKLAGERQQKVEELTKAREKLAKRPSEVQLQLEKLIKDLDEQVKLAAERQVLLEKANATKEEQVRLAQELQKKVESLEGAQVHKDKLAVDSLAWIEQLKAELQQARQAANLATKLQLLRESDLEELQQRYRDAIATQERQHHLLGELEERLRAAAQYFSQMLERQDQHADREE